MSVLEGHRGSVRRALPLSDGRILSWSHGDDTLRIWDSVSGYGTRRYHYYRCRSTARGRSPCRGIGVSAYEIERFVVDQVINGWIEHTQPSEIDESNWRIHWQLLEESEQRTVLAEIVQEVVYDPERGKVSVTIAPDADQRLIKFGIRLYGC